MKYKLKTAVGVVLNNQGQVLLGRCDTDDDRDGLLCFPGGGIDDGEDIFSAAIREVKEETNITTAIEQMVFSIHNTKDFVAYVVLKDTGYNTEVKFNDEYDRSNPGGWYSLDSLPTDEVFNLNLDVLQNLNLIPKYNVEYKTNNETIKNMIELGASAKELLEATEYIKEAKWGSAEQYGNFGSKVSAMKKGDSLVTYDSATKTVSIGKGSGRGSYWFTGKLANKKLVTDDMISDPSKFGLKKVSEDPHYEDDIDESLNEGVYELAKAIISGDKNKERQERLALKRSSWNNSDIEKALAKEMKSRAIAQAKAKQDKAAKLAAKWTKSKYTKWIKGMAYNNDDADLESDYARDMAQNAKFEKGLIEYVEGLVRREGGDEDALDRIQWDIEAAM